MDASEKMFRKTFAQDAFDRRSLDEIKSSQVAFNAVCQTHTVTMKCK